MNKKLFSLFVTLLFMPFIAMAQGQDDSSIEVTARVMETLTVIAVNDLDFGDVLQGVNKTINPDAAEAGRFDVSGEAGSEIDITFTLPTELELETDPSQVMVISFSSTSGIYNTTNDAGAGNSFNPADGATAMINSGSGELYVFIGGMIEPTVSQFPGNYEGTITLTVEYSGI